MLTSTQQQGSAAARTPTAATTTTTTATTAAAAAKVPPASTTAQIAKPRRSVLGRLARGLAVLGVAGGVGLAVQAKRDEGTARSLEFWRIVMPIYAHYRYVQWKVSGMSDEEQDRAFNELHDRYAPVVRDAVLQLRGFYLKACQVVSTVDYFCPPQYLKWAKEMQDQAPTTLQPGEAERIVAESLGKPLDEVFSSFETTPCGCASIGQVHRARLRSNGEEVAVKVQAPGIEHKFRADIGTVKAFCQFALPHMAPPMEEIERQFETEFDYLGEASNLTEVHDKIMPVFGSRVAIPKPYPEYSTSRVLVMEFLDGQPLIDGIRESMKIVAEHQGRSYEDLEREHWELIRLGKFEDIDKEEKKFRHYQRLLDAQRTVHNGVRAVYNGTLGMVFGRVEYEPRIHLLNLAHIIRLMAKVHGHEILIDGVFNCDPHPGNILLLKDGRLGLIDLGQCKRLPKDFQRTYAQLIIALDNGEKEKVVSLMQQMGNTSKYGNVDVQYRLAQFWHDRSDKEVFQGKNLQEFLEFCESEDPVVGMGDHLVMPSRVSVLLRGISNAFGIDLSIARLWRPIAEEALSSSAQA
ncbi:Atypical kinase COQ8B, mitochondrial [Hondaea fermentalgiana]|uniref:Atypical kinase COQ8B, mitochondrial n=1 Tax=Hondaea fermentalgiana TaxID=2315210 RepID=A0A2R5GN78_9STRA|nr:Atypical kinase COQ8B, mitochondrial [Hondaea fermentalgiana]|eukprot:GBG29761.1 Atypical kinase COQ8B, mitochondrial [Hondaea fermentalgiana]